MNENYVVIEKYWINVTPEEKEAAIEDGQFIICKERDPKYPLMNFAVYDPCLKVIDNFIAIFRKIENAKIFINALANKDEE